MNSFAVFALALLCPVAGAFVGMAFRTQLPEHHLSRDSTDVIKLATGLMATLVALVLSLLVSSANAFYGTVESEYKQALTDIVQLDRYLEAFGPEAGELRTLARHIVVQTFQQRWPDDDFGPKQPERAAGQEPLIDLERGILRLTPTDAAQKRFQSQALQLTQRLVAVRQLLSSVKSGRRLPPPILVVLLVCSAAIFASFSLFVRPNPTVLVALGVAALAVASAVFLIVELNSPFGGILQLASDPAHAVLRALTR
jgi:Protein of unknown function (DUF4239)